MNSLDHQCGSNMGPQRESMEGYGGLALGGELTPHDQCIHPISLGRKATNVDKL